MAAPAETFRLDPVKPERYSMTFMRASDGCLRRAHHDREEDTTGDDAMIGRFFHEGAAATGFAVTIRGDTTPGPGEVVRIFRRVLARPEEIQPLSRHVWTEVMDLAAKWHPTFAVGERFEITMRHEINGTVLSARIDRLFIDGTVAHVRDYKTGWADPPQRPEPTPQGDNYAWHCFMEFPWLTEVVFEQEHPRFGFEPVPFTYTRESFDLIHAWLADKVSALNHAYARGGELPTNPGAACDQWDGCAVAADCPAKQWARPGTLIRSHEDAIQDLVKLLAEKKGVGDLKDQIRGWLEREALRSLIESDDDAIAQFEALLATDASVAQRKKQIRGFLTRAGVRALQHNGQEIGFGVEAGTSTDWKGLAESLGGDPADFTKPKSPSFGIRKAKAN